MKPMVVVKYQPYTNSYEFEIHNAECCQDIFEETADRMCRELCDVMALDIESEEVIDEEDVRERALYLFNQYFMAELVDFAISIVAMPSKT